MTGLAYVAWAMTVCAAIGAAVYLISTGSPWWGLAFLLLAASWGVTSQRAGSE